MNRYRENITSLYLTPYTNTCTRGVKLLKVKKTKIMKILEEPITSE